MNKIKETRGNKETEKKQTARDLNRCALLYCFLRVCQKKTSNGQVIDKDQFRNPGWSTNYNHQICLKLFNMIFLAIMYNLVKKNSNIMALKFEHIPLYLYTEVFISRKLL